MNTFKRYITLVTTLTLATSLPLGAMKRKDNPVTPSNETEEKKIKITSKQNMQDLSKHTKQEMLLWEKFHEAIQHIYNVSKILNTTYEQEKNTPIEKLPENSLRQMLKKNDMPEDIFLQALKTYFCPEAIQLFISWCETTCTEENDKIFESVINYVLEHESDGNFSIHDEIKSICNKEKIKYPSIEEFNKKYKEQGTETRQDLWIKYKKENMFNSNTINISHVPTLKKLIDETAQEIGVEIKSIDINNCDSTRVNSEDKKLYLDINRILYEHHTNNEIKASLQHECSHIKNNDSCCGKILKIITSFFKSASKENLLLIINDKNSIDLIQQGSKNQNFIYQYLNKTRELFADKEVYDRNNIIHLMTFFAKYFIKKREELNQEDPISVFSLLSESCEHLPIKPRVSFWANKLKKQGWTFTKDTPHNTDQKQNNNYLVTTWFPDRQEYSNFAINAVLTMFFMCLEKNDNIKKIQESLKEVDMTSKIFCLALTCAKKKHLLTIIQELSKPENNNILQKIRTTVLCQIFVNATINGDKEIVTEFFKQENKNVLEKITNYTFKESTINAFLNDIDFHDTYSIILNLLEFKLGDYIDTKNLNESLCKIESTSSNYKKIINFLFMPENKISLRKIDKDTLGRVLQKAIHDNNLKIVNKFFDTENNDVLKRTFLNSALQDCLVNQKIEILKLFFKHGKGIFTQYHMGMIIAAAKPDKIIPGRTKEGYEDILREFFKEENSALFEGINFGKRLYAGPKPIKVVKKAIKYGTSPKTLQIILDNNTIKQKDLKKALEKARTKEIKETINKYIKE